MKTRKMKYWVETIGSSINELVASLLPKPKKFKKLNERNSEMRDMIFEYVRRNISKRNMKVGILVAQKFEDGQVAISWSKCHTGKDQFDNLIAMSIAEYRFNHGCTAVVPRSMEKDIERFIDRSKRYFKTDNIVVLGNNAKKAVTA